MCAWCITSMGGVQVYSQWSRHFVEAQSVYDSLIEQYPDDYRWTARIIANDDVIIGIMSLCHFVITRPPWYTIQRALLLLSGACSRELGGFPPFHKILLGVRALPRGGGSGVWTGGFAGETPGPVNRCVYTRFAAANLCSWECGASS